MEKYYVEEILEIFKKEKNVQNSITGNYVPEITKLFDLANCNVQALRAIRDAVVFRIDMVKSKDEDNRYFYSQIISYVTSVIDEYIWKKGGEV